MMDDTHIKTLRAAEARQALTDGDLKSEVAFQNDINRLLASLDDLWQAPDPQPLASRLADAA
jgi:hypothetical protein